MTQVKICGLTSLVDALTAAEAGADLLGFVFHAPSPRSVDPDEVAPIAARVRQAYPRIRLVGVFVDWDPIRLARTAERCGLDCVQLHGEETPGAVDQLIARGLGVIKGFRVRDSSALGQMALYRPTYYLLDTYVAGQAGGTGEAFDWRLARHAPENAPVLLAGGLTPGNVAEAVRVAEPWGVDVSSGVEMTPGRKDPDRVRRFIAAAKGIAGEVLST